MFTLSSRHAAPDSHGKMIWTVTLTYTLNDGSQNNNQNPKQPNPLDDARQIEWATETIQLPTHYDFQGNAILNSAGQYFENGVMRDVMNYLVTFTMNVAGVPSWVNSYFDAVNAGPVTIEGLNFAAKQLKVKSINISRWQRRNFIPFRVLKLVLAARATWDRKLLDEGLLVKGKNQAGGGTYYGPPAPAILSNGQKATRPVLLDGNGNVLANPGPGNAVFLTFTLYPLKDFSQLPIQ
jgi:hypothetical protein